MEILKLREHSELAAEAAAWFHWPVSRPCDGGDEE